MRKNIEIFLRSWEHIKMPSKVRFLRARDVKYLLLLVLLSIVDFFRNFYLRNSHDYMVLVVGAVSVFFIGVHYFRNLVSIEGNQIILREGIFKNRIIINRHEVASCEKVFLNGRLAELAVVMKNGNILKCFGNVSPEKLECVFAVIDSALNES